MEVIAGGDVRGDSLGNMCCSDVDGTVQYFKAVDDMVVLGEKIDAEGLHEQQHELQALEGRRQLMGTFMDILRTIPNCTLSLV